MKYKLELASLSECQSDLACVFVFANEKVSEVFKDADAAFGRKLKPFVDMLGDHVTEDGFKGKAGQVLNIPTFGHLDARRIVLIGLGESKDFSTSHARKAAANLVRRLPGDSFQGNVSFYFRQASPAKATSKTNTAKRQTKTASAAKSGSPTNDSEIAQAIVEGIHLASYSFKKYKSSKNGDNKKENLFNRCPSPGCP